MTRIQLDELREEHGGLSMREAAKRAGVSHSTWSKWERGDYGISDESRRKIEGAFGVDLEEYEMADGDESTGWVRSPEQRELWRDAVVAAGPDQWELIILMALPSFLDSDTWVVSVTPEAIADHMGDRYDVEPIQEAWPSVLDSDLVEIIGKGEWTLKLVIPSD